jgi:hypothetical protein
MGPHLDPNLRWCLNAPLAFMLNTSAMWERVTRLTFFITYSNDVDASRACMFCGEAGAHTWRAYVSTWVDAMRHPRYMKVTLNCTACFRSPSNGLMQVDGRPVFQILIPDVFSQQCGGDTALADSLLDDLRLHYRPLRRYAPSHVTTRSAAETAGVGRAIIGGGWQNPSVPSFPPAPRPHPNGYMRYPQCDIDCRGCNVGFLAVADESACMAACNSTSSCVAFVAVPVPSSGKVNCTLKSVAGPGLLPLPLRANSS